jgi:hypothetical protein
VKVTDAQRRMLQSTDKTGDPYDHMRRGATMSEQGGATQTMSAIMRRNWIVWDHSEGTASLTDAGRVALGDPA